MSYEIIPISAVDMEKVESKLIGDNNSFLARIDGRQCKTKRDYLLQISEALQFPEKVSRSWDAYLDWIRDLTWIDEKTKIILVIYSFSEFLERDTAYKEVFLSDFEECIFPFWEEEVLDCVVDGKTRQFEVYLVD